MPQCVRMDVSCRVVMHAAPCWRCISVADSGLNSTNSLNSSTTANIIHTVCISYVLHIAALYLRKFIIAFRGG